MSSFDTTLRIADPHVMLIEDEDTGKSYEAHILVQQLTLIPVGPNQVAAIPLGVLRMPVAKKALEAFVKEAQVALEGMSERSDITIAGNMNEADQVARTQSRFK